MAREMTGGTGNDYHSTRLKEDQRRTVLWQVLGAYLQRFVQVDGKVLDFGAGYCGFINEIQAAQKYAYDQWPGIRDHAGSGVEPIVGHFSQIEAQLPAEHLDVIFASNVFEHFDLGDLTEVVTLLASRLRRGGRLVLVQPNFRLAFRNYFDDYTHKSIWTDTSLPDFLATLGFDPVYVKGNFLPLTVKSRLPVHPMLIRAYLHSPVRPMAGQMLVVVEKR